MLWMLPCQVSRLMVLSSIVGNCLNTGVTKCQGVGLEGFHSNYAANYRGVQISGGWFRGVPL